ncbi:cupin domain-containing protein [Pseudomonas putida]|uniref:cupin domain-containing protein n=1 Tax=Pseudomonas putida TaxID=303 RepID=UPI002365E441|nr:cupin [Pseudomonas putida]MDD2050406.1 cupin domain-containing protein [Pseudomonas putida]
MKALKASLSGLILAASAATVFAQSEIKAETLISVPNAALQWQAVPNTNGAVTYANTEGDIFGKGDYSAFVTFKAGTDNGLHRHSQSLPTVVLKGTFYAVIDKVRTEYPTGSYYKLPASLVHESGCTAAADCLLFQYQADSFDLVPVKG